MLRKFQQIQQTPTHHQSADYSGESRHGAATWPTVPALHVFVAPAYKTLRPTYLPSMTCQHLTPTPTYLPPGLSSVVDLPSTK